MTERPVPHSKATRWADDLSPTGIRYPAWTVSLVPRERIDVYPGDIRFDKIFEEKRRCYTASVGTAAAVAEIGN